MPMISVNNVGALGVIRDRPGHELPPEAWTDANNMRFYNKNAFRFLGHEQALGNTTVIPGFVMNVPNGDNDFWLYASLTAVYGVDSALTHTDITRAAGAYTASAYRDWNGCILGGIPILNNGADVPQAWGALSLATDLTNLSFWTGTLRAKVIRSFGPFLVALNLTAGATALPHAIQWSHPADPGAVPLSWDITDPTRDAGRKELTDAKGGTIVDGLILGNQFIIYKQSSTHVMRYVGGQEIMATNLLLNSGILAPRCMALIDMGRRHFVCTEDDLIVHNGTSEVRSVLEEQDRVYLFDDLDQSNYLNSFCFDNPKYREAWFCYPAAGATYPNKAVVWNYLNDTVTFRDFEGTSADIGRIAATEASWNSDAESWDTDATAWSLAGPRSIGIGSVTGSKIFKLDSGYAFGSSITSSFLERTGLAVIGRDRQGAPKLDFSQRRLIRRIWPKIRGNATVNVRVGFQERLDGDVAWTGVKPYSATQRYLDFEAAGLMPAVRFESTSDASWQLEGYDIEIEPLGVL